MEAKVYLLIAIALISGLVSGYFFNSSIFQGQTDLLYSQVANLETTVTTLQINCTHLQNNYTHLLVLYSDLFLQQAQTINSSTSQNQTDTLQSLITNLETTINMLQTNYAELQNNYTELYILYSNLLSQQSQTQVRIDKISWDVSHNKITVVVRNTGNVTATIGSISVKKSVSDSTFYIQSYTKDNSINTGETVTFTWTEEGASASAGFLAYLTEYIIRVTATTSFQYELVATSPIYR